VLLGLPQSFFPKHEKRSASDIASRLRAENGLFRDGDFPQERFTLRQSLVDSAHIWFALLIAILFDCVFDFAAIAPVACHGRQ
jgi:hypothetical protein